jgi:chromosome segregation ATPase
VPCAHFRMSVMMRLGWSKLWRTLLKHFSTRFVLPELYVLVNTMSGLHVLTVHALQLSWLRQQYASERDTMAAELHGSKSAEDTERMEKFRLQKALVASCDEVTQLQRMLGEKDTALVNLNCNLSQLQLERIEDRSRLDALEDTVELMRSEAHKAVSRAAEKNQFLERVRNDLSMAQVELAATQERLQDAEKRCGAQENRCAHLFNGWEDCKSNVRHLKTEVKQLTSDLEDQVHQSEELRATVTLRANELHHASNELAACTLELEGARAKLDELRTELQDANLQAANAQVCCHLPACATSARPSV